MKTERFAKTSDCVVKYGANFVTGMAMVVGVLQYYLLAVPPLEPYHAFIVCVCVS